MTVRIDRDIEQYMVRPGDVLFLSRGHRLSAVVVGNVPRNIIVPNYYYILRPKPVVLPDDLTYESVSDTFERLGPAPTEPVPRGPDQIGNPKLN